MSGQRQLLHQHHQHPKFRWTENLTCRFIQLRKDHGMMFTGRKYSAQAGWEYILRQMKEEFPTIMADVHYRVLKKKWSNLLQQYKELKNPVHGDKNKADDISWPFYTAIDEVLGNLSGSPSHRSANSSNNHYNDEEDADDVLNPQEFLCVSVAPDNEDEEYDDTMRQLGINRDDIENEKASIFTRLQQQQQQQQQPLRSPENKRTLTPVFDVERIPRTMRQLRKRSLPNDNDSSSSSSSLLSRLPRATELTIRPVRRTTASTTPTNRPVILPDLPALERIVGSANERLDGDCDVEDKREPNEGDRISRSKKYARTSKGEATARLEDGETRLERRFVEFFEYTKRRDEENTRILLRMLKAVEDIRKAVG